MGWEARQPRDHMDTHRKGNGTVFGAPQEGGHLLGQPITVRTLGLPVNVTFTCNCQGEAATELTISNSIPVVCPHCERTFSAFWNPQKGQLKFNIQPKEIAADV